MSPVNAERCLHRIGLSDVFFNPATKVNVSSRTNMLALSYPDVSIVCSFFVYLKRFRVATIGFLLSSKHSNFSPVSGLMIMSVYLFISYTFFLLFEISTSFDNNITFRKIMFVIKHLFNLKTPSFQEFICNF